jgi:Nucleotide-sugar transporter
MSGLMATQFKPGIGAKYPYSVYFILMFQVFLSASAGVYNMALLKRENSSLHASNMMLYGSGVAVNLILYVTLAVFKTNEPGFFAGYDNIGAIMMILSNVFIGLAITAVYKCPFKLHNPQPIPADIS